MEHRGHQHALDPPESGRVLVAHVPDIAHGGMAIADMQRAGTGEHALGGSRFAGNDEVVAPQVELFQSQRHEGQIFLVPAPGKGQGTDEGGRDRTARQARGQGCAVEHEGEDVGLGKEAAQLLDDLFAAALGHKPVMHDRCFQMRPPGKRSGPEYKKELSRVTRRTCLTGPPLLHAAVRPPPVHPAGGCAGRLRMGRPPTAKTPSAGRQTSPPGNARPWAPPARVAPGGRGCSPP